MVAPLVGDQLGRSSEIGARVPFEAETGHRVERDRLLTIAVGAAVFVCGRAFGSGLDPRPGR